MTAVDRNAYLFFLLFKISRVDNDEEKQAKETLY